MMKLNINKNYWNKKAFTTEWYYYGNLKWWKEKIYIIFIKIIFVIL